MEQKSLFAKLKMIFPRKERRYFVVLFFLILIGTAFDFLGVSLILPWSTCWCPRRSWKNGAGIAC